MIGLQVMGVAKLAKKLGAEIARYTGNPVCEVGVGADYAIYVHEILGHAHATGEAKFMENAMNAIRSGYAERLAKLCRKYAAAGHRKPLAAALYAMGLIIDTDAVRRMPVKTGRMRGTHYVAPPDGIAASDAPARPGK